MPTAAPPFPACDCRPVSFGPVRFRHPLDGHEQQQRRACAQQQRNAAPADRGYQIAGDYRRQHGTHDQRHGHEAHRPGELLRRYHVGRHRASHRGSRRHADRLHHPSQDQHRKRIRPVTDGRADTEHRKPQQDHAPSPEAVGDRSIRQHGKRERGGETGYDPLRVRDGCGKILPDTWERRYEDLHCKRTQRMNHRNDDNDCPRTRFTYIRH